MAQSDDDDLFDEFGDFDMSTLDEVARLEAQVNDNPILAKTTAVSRAQPANGLARTSSNLQQKDLFGNNVPQSSIPSRLVSNAGASTSRAAGGQALASSQELVNAVVRKKWDRTRYVKSGFGKKNAPSSKAKAGKNKGKGKARFNAREEGEGEWLGEEDSEEDFEEEEGPYDSDDPLYDPDEANKPIRPMKLKPDLEACKTFVYPISEKKALRKYQYDIVTKAFYTDTLVALPTGLGKTFLAAVVMLNFYRWFPKGKIIFMAPSRPLVTQQIQACHGIAGIPLEDAVELTGKDKPEKRTEEWRHRRVFYCTPQTARNDLVEGRLDPTDVVLVVVDEAHKATGDYAYTGVVRFLMQKNPHFRVLALTATPGGDPTVVQTVVDNLHIGHIEVRTDESLDIRQYVHDKQVDLLIIPIDGEILSIRDRYIVLMNILLDPVKKAGLIKTHRNDPTTIHPYQFQAAIPLCAQTKQPWGYAILAFLGAMSRAISKLLQQSVKDFADDFVELENSAKGKAKNVISHPNYKSIKKDVLDIVNGRDFEGHPKMVKLRELAQEHFQVAEQKGELDRTRIMVFCTSRTGVEEIVERLNASNGIRATRLVGQGSDSKGKKGLGQKGQNEVLNRFKRGDYNVLVATSIGEEGLDIGELDLIICYEAPKSSIRTLQRAGRTGRARDGRIVVMMTEGIEEDNWRQANEKYKGVQNAIVSGKLFELYSDCQRLLPVDVRPRPDKRELVIPPFDPDKLLVGHRLTGTGKRKRDEGDNIDVFETGFQKANGKKVGEKKTGAAGAKRSLSTTAKSKAKLADPDSDFEEAFFSDDGLLTSTQMGELLKKPIRPSVQAAQPSTSRLASFPSDFPSQGLGRRPSAAPTTAKRFIGNSTRTAALAKTFKQAHDFSRDESTYEAWKNQTYPAFNSSLVEWWPDDKAGKGKAKNFHSPMRLPPDDRTGSSASGSSKLASSHSARAASKPGSKGSIRDDIGVISDEDEVEEEERGLPSVGNKTAATVSGQVRRKEDAMIQMNDDEDDMEDLPEISPEKLQRQSSLLRPTPRASSVAKSRKPQLSSPPRPFRNSAENSVRNGHHGPISQPTSAPLVIDLVDDEEEAEDNLIDNAKTPATATLVQLSTTAPSTAPSREVQPDPALKRRLASPAQIAPNTLIVPDSDDLYDDFDMDDIIADSTKLSGRTSAVGEVKLATPPMLSQEEHDIAADTDLMPPPTKRAPTAISNVSGILANSSYSDSPVIFRRAGAAPRRVLTDGEASSPDKIVTRPRKRVALTVEGSPAVDPTQPRPVGRLVRYGQKNAIAIDDDEEVDDSVQLVTQPADRRKGKENREKSQRKGKKQKKLPADDCPFFDMRAINSDDPDSETDSDDGIDPETTTDRRFLASDDTNDKVNMTAFYRESLMSQAAPHFKGDVVRPGAYKLRVDSHKRYKAPKRSEEQPEPSQWSFDSFCVADDEEIVYEDDTDGLPDDSQETSLSAG